MPRSDTPYTLPVRSAQGRRMRRPQHRFAVRQRLWEITPFFLAPVLPGETMRSLLFQARAELEYITSSRVGFWLEHYFFYVKHRDLDARDQLTEMMLDPNWDAESSDVWSAGGSTVHYTRSGSMGWSPACLKRVVEEYFRNEGEPWDLAVGPSGLPLAKINQESALNSAILASQWEDLDVSIAEINEAGSAEHSITAAGVHTALQQWELLRTMGLTEMSYEDFLRLF